MSEHSEPTFELRRIAWSEALPFVRLFRSGKRAISFTPMALAFALVVVVYTGGRLFDALWLAADAGVPWVGSVSEAHAYVGGEGFAEWKRAASKPNAPGIVVRGPFETCMKYQRECVGSLVQSLLGGGAAFTGRVLRTHVGLLGSLAAMIGGVAWLMTQHPWFMLLYGLWVLFAMALFGGAICRYAAVQAAREETIEMRTALHFAREKWLDLVGGPLFLIGMLLFGLLVILLGGLLVGRIPYVGEIVVALLFGLSLLGGALLVFALLALVFGTHLMWPTIAVEGSDLFDAITRAGGYVFSRAWSLGLYSLMLLVYGTVCFVFVRLMALLLFKLTHSALAAGMSWFGRVHSSGSETLGKLEGMWSLPAWSELPLLPGAGSVNFWGSFGVADGLRWSESLSMILLMLWVFSVVALVYAFAVSFYFCGATEMYFLLRREADLVDYDEIYYEEDEEQPSPFEESLAEEKPSQAEAEQPSAADTSGPSEQPPPPSGSESDSA